MPTRAITPNRNVALDVACTIDQRPRYQIAAAAGMSTTTFGHILAGRVEPTQQQRYRIAAALDRPIDELFDVSRAAGLEQVVN